LPETEISIDDCKHRLNQVFDNIENIEYICENNNLIGLYEFNVKFKNEVEKTINITRKGGVIYSILSDKKVEEQKLNIDVLERIGLDFCNKLGIDNMTTTYYIITDNLITINYAPVQDNVLLYPDLIKVKIAMDNGEVLSYESMGYTFNHVKRQDIIPKYSLEECRKVINKNLEIIKTTLCIIPTDSKREVLCYEFKTKLKDQEYSIYINTITKLEEKVLMIIKSPEGTLTI
jgi:spore germination protein